jgi:hypothetical protein
MQHYFIFSQISQTEYFLMFQKNLTIVLMNYVESAFYDKFHVVEPILYEYHSPLYVHYEAHKLNRMNE